MRRGGRRARVSRSLIADLIGRDIGYRHSRCTIAYRALHRPHTLPFLVPQLHTARSLPEQPGLTLSNSVTLLTLSFTYLVSSVFNLLLNNGYNKVDEMCGNVCVG